MCVLLQIATKRERHPVPIHSPLHMAEWPVQITAPAGCVIIICAQVFTEYLQSYSVLQRPVGFPNGACRLHPRARRQIRKQWLAILSAKRRLWHVCSSEFGTLYRSRNSLFFM